MELAIFSACVTIFLEKNEWDNYLKKGKENKNRKKVTIYHYFLILIYITFILLIIIYRGIDLFFKIPNYVASFLPNFITALTLFFYFLSYALRTIIIRYDKTSGEK